MLCVRHRSKLCDLFLMCFFRSLVSFPAPGSYQFSDLPVFSMEGASDNEEEKEVDPLNVPVDAEQYWMPVRFTLLFKPSF